MHKLHKAERKDVEGMIISIIK